MQLRRLFRVSLFLKAAFSLSEIVGGVLAYFISQRYLLHLVTTFTQDELTEDPRDFVAHFLHRGLHVLRKQVAPRVVVHLHLERVPVF